MIQKNNTRLRPFQLWRPPSLSKMMRYEWNHQTKQISPCIKLENQKCRAIFRIQHP
jgi:hypothetical protein